MKKLPITQLIAIGILFLATQSLALFGSSKVLEGTVQAIEADIITVAKQSSSQMPVIESLDIKVDAQTVYENVASLKNLREGDQVKVEYKEEKSDRIAISVTKVEGKDAKSDQAT